ncbi:MAG: isochorismatase [Cyanobacteria bacterium J06641_5]
MTFFPIPSFFEAARVGEVWRVPYQERAVQAAAWAAEQGIQAAASDLPRVGLLIIDMQNTFCLPEFELYVGGRSGRGAIEDATRLCEFIYRNLGRLTQIIATLDTHLSVQIFHPIFWLNSAGEHPAPVTVVTAAAVRSGAWQVNPAIAANFPGWTLASLQEYALHYVEQLEASGKYPLTVWPYHGKLGGISHALVSAVEEACFFHSIARSSQTLYETKGDNPLTENYSVLRPEVMCDRAGNPIARANKALCDRLLEFDALIVAGEAKSHCVAWTVADLLAEIQQRNPSWAQKVYLLDDCSSPVTIPGVVDYTEAAEAAYAKFAAAGMQRVKSTESLEVWPGFPT